MFKAYEEYEELLNQYDFIPEEAEEFIVNMYMVARLNPLLDKKVISKDELNSICIILTDHYFDHEISLDIMINAIYNYINANKISPSELLLSDDIESLLKNYSEE